MCFVVPLPSGFIISIKYTLIIGKSEKWNFRGITQIENYGQYGRNGHDG